MKTETAHLEGRRRLDENLRQHAKLLVAYSGGVDSTFLLRTAVGVLGAKNVLGVTGASDSLGARELEEARALAVRFGARHRVIETQELDDPRYASNPRNRCYFCKGELYGKLREVARQEGFETIADGTNLDDARDVRPGRQAAREQGVVSPLLEARLTKQDIRDLSFELGLPTWDKPEMPCLASRIPYGSPVETGKLRQIEAAEESVRLLGIRGARVRHHGALARLEVQPSDLDRLADRGLRQQLVQGIRDAGFEFVTLDLEGYRRGRLNETRDDSSGGSNPTARSD